MCIDPTTMGIISTIGGFIGKSAAADRQNAQYQANAVNANQAATEQYYEKTKGKQINSHIMNYSYQWVNYDQAALPGNEFNPYTASYGPNAKVRIDSAFMRNGAIVDTVIIKPLRHLS